MGSLAWNEPILITSKPHNIIFNYDCTYYRILLNFNQHLKGLKINSLNTQTFCFIFFEMDLE